jgi:hypothetical protein
VTRGRILAAAALFAILYLAPMPGEPRFRLCGFYWLTGFPCALCGLTRGVFALAKGHWTEAIHWNALSPLGLAMMFSLFWNHAMRGYLWTAGIASFAGYGIWRLVTGCQS